MLASRSVLGMLAIAMGALSAFLGYRIDELPGESGIAPGTFPMALGIILMLLGVLLIYLEQARAGDGKSFGQAMSAIRKGGAIPLAAIFLLYCLTFEYLPFLVSSFLFLVAGILILGERRWKYILAVAIGADVILFSLFRYVFSVFLP